MSLKMQCGICECIFDSLDAHSFEAEVMTSRKKSVVVTARVTVISKIDQNGVDHVCRQCIKAVIRGNDT